jgi:DNA-binding response OmpR family regulator
MPNDLDLYNFADDSAYPSATPPFVEGLDLDMVFDAPYRPRVLIVDDDPDTVFMLKLVLRQAGFDVTGAYTSDQALNKVTNSNPDIILLDLMMPEIDGWMTYDYLRQVTDAPVMIVSALTNKDIVVRGLQLGAEDYVTKPFFNAEVVARVQNIVRRSATKQATRKTLNFPAVELTIDLESREVAIRGTAVHLTAKEFAIFELLARQAPRMVRYQDMALKVWGVDTPDVRKSIKYLIYLLRRKLEVEPSRPTLILNSEKLGYKLQTEGDNGH